MIERRPRIALLGDQLNQLRVLARIAFQMENHVLHRSAIVHRRGCSFCERGGNEGMNIAAHGDRLRFVDTLMNTSSRPDLGGLRPSLSKQQNRRTNTAKKTVPNVHDYLANRYRPALLDTNANSLEEFMRRSPILWTRV